MMRRACGSVCAAWIAGVLASCTPLNDGQTGSSDGGISCDGPPKTCDTANGCAPGEICAEDGHCECVTALEIDTRALPAAVVGERYSQMLRANGGAGPYAYRLVDAADALNWLSLDPVTGRFGGVPSATEHSSSEAFGLHVEVEDRAQQVARQSLTLAVGTCHEGEDVVCFTVQDAACFEG